MRVFVFPGQGAQAIGMGKALATHYRASKAVFDEVDDALGQNLSDLIWEGDIESLTLTKNAQPALMATSLAALRALEVEGISFNTASFVAGHSLGEYSALAAVGAFSISDAARLLRLRGSAMQEAVPVGIGAMAAILGLDFVAVKSVAKAASQGQICEVANDNDPGQVVVSGHKAAVERAIDLAQGAGAKRAILLPVSAPFHCSLMEPAAEQMAIALEEINIMPPSLPIVANVRACSISDPSIIRSLLVEQITGPVRWRESVLFLASEGVTEFWEIGAGKALSGMIRRVDRTLSCQIVNTPEDIAKIVELEIL